MGGHEERFSRDPLPVFSAGGRCEQFWHVQRCPLFDVVHPAFPLPTTASPTLLKNGFGEAVVACDMSEPCKFPSLDSCQKRFLWAHEEVDLALHPVVGHSRSGQICSLAPCSISSAQRISHRRSVKRKKKWSNLQLGSVQYQFSTKEQAQKACTAGKKKWSNL